MDVKFRLDFPWNVGQWVYKIPRVLLWILCSWMIRSVWVWKGTPGVFKARVFVSVVLFSSSFCQIYSLYPLTEPMHCLQLPVYEYLVPFLIVKQSLSRVRRDLWYKSSSSLMPIYLSLRFIGSGFCVMPKIVKPSFIIWKDFFRASQADVSSRFCPECPKTQTQILITECPHSLELISLVLDDARREC